MFFLFRVLSVSLGLGTVCSLVVFWIGSPAIAQVVEDTTLGNQRSTVSRTRENSTLITIIRGGAVRGDNLFHSFEQFSIPRGQAAQFDNDGAIANIISRVTGTSRSRINGAIEANGDANLFLINPNGIVMGPEARLDIGGSFVGSTASGIEFADGTVFQAATQSTPLLSVSAPIGLQMGSDPGPIRVMVGSEPSIPTGPALANTDALRVGDGQTLALIGGPLTLNGAILQASGGRIELGSVGRREDVAFSLDADGIVVDFDDVNRVGPIRLTNQSLVNASGDPGGAIALRGSDIQLMDGSAIVSDTWGDRNGDDIAIAAESFRSRDGAFVSAFTFGEGMGGNINLVASRSIRISGVNVVGNQGIFLLGALRGLRQVSDRQNGLFTGTDGTGDAGNIRIAAPRFSLLNGAIISAETLGRGDGGNVTITSPQTMRVIGSIISTSSLISGVPIINEFLEATGENTEGITSGDAGNLRVTTRELIMRNGGSISASTIGDGNAGNVWVRASDSIQLGKFFGVAFVPTGISSITIGGTGDGGNVTLETGRLTLRGGAEIFTNSGAVAVSGIVEFGGAAGDLTVNASEFIELTGRVGDGVFPSELVSESFSPSDSGDIRVSTPRLVMRDGAQISASILTSPPDSPSPNPPLNNSKGGTLTIDADIIELSGQNSEFPTGLFSASGDLSRGNLGGTVQGIESPGDGGALRITTGELRIRDGAEVAVSSVGTGDAGTLTINADSIDLDRQGRITAATSSGEGGNIILGIDDILLLRRNSLISAEAGGIGNGGNIRIAAPNAFIVAVPSENSDIIASAEQGNGGNIQITTQSLLGIEPRDRLTPLSDINASSETGVDGVIIIEQPEVQPTEDNVDLPSEFSAPPLAQGCRAQSAQNRFVDVGRGGLPINPADPISATVIWQDLDDPGLGSDAPQAALPISGLEREMGRESPNDAEFGAGEATASHSLPQSPEPAVLTEAQGWTVGSDGTVMLVADASVVSPTSLHSPPSLCQR